MTRILAEAVSAGAILVISSCSGSGANGPSGSVPFVGVIHFQGGSTTYRCVYGSDRGRCIVSDSNGPPARLDMDRERYCVNGAASPRNGASMSPFQTAAMPPMSPTGRTMSVVGRPCREYTLTTKDGTITICADPTLRPPDWEGPSPYGFTLHTILISRTTGPNGMTGVMTTTFLSYGSVSADAFAGFCAP